MKDEPFADLSAAMAAVDDFDGPPEAFRLAVTDSLQDPIGMNMALITDRILAKGWWPDGFEQGEGFRVYRYRRME